MNRPDFTCPECGSHEFGSSADNPHDPTSAWRWTRHCHGHVPVPGTDPPSYRSCSYTWPSSDDERHGLVRGDELGKMVEATDRSMRDERDSLGPSGIIPDMTILPTEPQSLPGPDVATDARASLAEIARKEIQTILSYLDEEAENEPSLWSPDAVMMVQEDAREAIARILVACGGSTKADAPEDADLVLRPEVATEPEQKEPIALVKLEDPTVVVAHACGGCGIVCGSVLAHGDQSVEMARRCCAPNRCEKCGRETKKYHVTCDACHALNEERRLRERFEEAAKLTVAEYYERPDVDAPVFDPLGGDFHDGVDDLREYYVDHPDEERPRWAWTTVTNRGYKPDAGDVIESVASEMHEDAHEEFDCAGLQALLDYWFENQKVVSHMEDDSRAIVLDENFWSEKGSSES